MPRSAAPIPSLCLVAVALLASAPSSAEAQRANLLGRVMDQSTNRPIENVAVRLEGVSGASVTNPLGMFRFSGIRPGMHFISLEALGYEDLRVRIEIPGDESYETWIRLGPDPLELEGLEVSVMPRKLYTDMVDLATRIDRGFGEFLLRGQIEERGGNLVNLIQGLPGVTVTGGGGSLSGRSVILRRARHITSTAPGVHVAEECYPAVFVDGKRFSRRARFGDQATDLTEFQAADLDAVEVYSGASVPAVFGGGDAPCGAVILWTRRGPARRQGT